MKRAVKCSLARLLNPLGADQFGRWMNRHKLVVVMYHGITRRSYQPAVWTQLPEHVFRFQIEFLARNYRPVSLRQMVDTLAGGEPLPERAVLITFDDGLRNNATVAWPILQALGVPATIFLTVDFIGTDRFLWVDELYLYMAEAYRCGVRLPLVDRPLAQRRFQIGDIWGAYTDLVEAYKRISEDERTRRLEEMGTMVPLDRSGVCEDFGMLDWNQVQVMGRDGLIDFGVHTATHRILTQMLPAEVDREIAGSRKTLENYLGRPVEAFCYPNGRPGTDFREEHEDLLRQVGYRCAFTTRRALFVPGVNDPFCIGRIPAGNDATSHPDIFRWNCAGLPG